MKQHARPNTVEDFVVRNQLNEMETMISYELLTLTDIMRLFENPKHKKHMASRSSSILTRKEMSMTSSVMEESAKTEMIDEPGDNINTVRSELIEPEDS